MNARRALVIGIDKYDDPWQLNGCVNDARVMAGLLREKFEFPDDGIRLLTDADATKDAILDAFDDLIDVTKQDDIVVFYFAGHGSRLAALEKTAKATGYTTGLCPVDVTHPGPELYYLVDDEIHERLLDLADRTKFITVVVDACHSGTVTRDAFGDRVRSMAADNATKSGFALYTKPRRANTRPSGANGKGPSGWISLSDHYVLIAGCRDEEVANEFSPPETEEKHGALTYFLTQELVKATSGTTYRDVFERAAANVTARKPLQHPQIEGRIDRAVFGVTELAPMDFAKITSRSGDRVTLNRGGAHGVTVGSRYHVHPQGTKSVSQSSHPLGELEIVSVGAVQSNARIVSEAPADAVAADARAFEVDHARGSMSMAVEIAAPPEFASQAARLRSELSTSPIVEVASARSPTAPFARLYLIAPRDAVAGSDPMPQLGTLGEPTWAVADTAGQLLFSPKRVGEERLIRESLEQVVKYTQALELDNPNPRSRLRGKFALDILRRDAAGAWEVAYPDTAGGLVVLEDGTDFAFRVTNGHTEPVYISVLDFQEHHALAPLFRPDGAMELLTTKRFEQGTVPVGSPDAWRLEGSFADGRDEQRETIKLFVTSTPADFNMLAQAGTRNFGRPGQTSPLTSLFRLAIGTSNGDDQRAGTRAIRIPIAENDPDDWTTVTTSFIIRRNRATSPRPAKLAASNETLDILEAAVGESGGQILRRVPLDEGRIEPGTRALEGPTFTLAIPPVTDGIPLLVRTDADGAVTFHFSDDTSGTRDLRASGAHIFRVPVDEPSPQPGTRDALSAITTFASTTIGSQVMTLIVYPALGGIVGRIGEDIAQSFESSFRPYRACRLTPDDYSRERSPAIDVDGWKHLAGGRALLLLHGAFDRSHRAFGAIPRPVIEQLDRLYEGRVFAFDHYTLSHDPRRNAKALLDAITLPAESGLELDILAHGRGGLVARSLVEGGADTLAGIERVRVRKVVFVGTPNAGTPFADVQNIEKTLNRYTMLAGTTLTQFGGPIAGALFAAAKSAAFKMAAQLKGVSAMKPGSVFLDSLKGPTSAAPDRTPQYYAVGSDFEPQEPGLMHRLRKLLADKTIVGAHDLVVSTRSAAETPAKFSLTTPKLLTQTDGVPHFGYFDNPSVHAAILRWLQEP